MILISLISPWTSNFSIFFLKNCFNNKTLNFFSRQTCGIEFLSFMRNNDITLRPREYRAFEEASKFRSDNLVWEVDSINDRGIIHGNLGSFETLEFTMTMRRNFHYYLISITVPLWIMVILMCCSFFIPPQSSERANFSATIMLSIFVLQGAVLGSLPTTRQPVITAYSMLIQTAIAAISTCYSCLMCWLLQNHKKIMAKSVMMNKWKLYSLLDVLAFIFISSSFLLANLVAVILITSN